MLRSACFNTHTHNYRNKLNICLPVGQLAISTPKMPFLIFVVNFLASVLNSPYPLWPRMSQDHTCPHRLPGHQAPLLLIWLYPGPWNVTLPDTCTSINVPNVSSACDWGIDCVSCSILSLWFRSPSYRGSTLLPSLFTVSTDSWQNRCVCNTLPLPYYSPQIPAHICYICELRLRVLLETVFFFFSTDWDFYRNTDT